MTFSCQSIFRYRFSTGREYHVKDMQTQDAYKTKLQKIIDKYYKKPRAITEEKDKRDRNRRKFTNILT